MKENGLIIIDMVLVKESIMMEHFILENGRMIVNRVMVY